VLLILEFFPFIRVNSHIFTKSLFLALFVVHTAKNKDLVKMCDF
jgi:hypothetical protein